MDADVGDDGKMTTTKIRTTVIANIVGLKDDVDADMNDVSVST